MSSSASPPKSKTTTPLILLGCLAGALLLGLILIGIAAFSMFPRLRNPIETLLAPKLTSTRLALPEATLAPVFKPTLAPLAGPTQVLARETPTSLPAYFSTLPVIFRDDFSWNTFTWYTGKVDNEYWQGEWAIRDGKYRLDLTSLQSCITWEYLLSVSLTDFEARVEIDQLFGAGESEGGLILRGTDDNYYTFLISTSGYYWFGLLHEGEWQTLLNWTSSDAIHSHGPNRLIVVGEGDQFRFYINDYLVGGVSDGQLKEGRFGVAVEAAENYAVLSEFDNFEIRAPASALPEGQVTRPQPEIPSSELAGLPGRIVFASNRDGNYELYSVKPDGSELKRLTDIPSDEYSPAWSPDGGQIAFVSNRDGNAEIYRMNADGSNPVRLTDHPAEDSSPAWSPDGSQIAFVSFRDENAELYVMDVNGENLERLTANTWRDFSPAWSPDGTRLAFLSDQEDELHIYIFTLESAQVTTFNQKASISSAGLTWSPYGQQIAFVSYEGGTSQVYVQDAEGNFETRLTTYPFDHLYPAWSGDGKYLAFTAMYGDSYEIFLLNVAAGNYFRLTDHPASDTAPGWGGP